MTDSLYVPAINKNITILEYNVLYYVNKKAKYGIIDCKGTETQQIFFSYACNGKKIKELFASSLNGIAASVRCVSSKTVGLNAKLPD